MANSEMILRLLTDLKIEQQLLKEQLEKMQTAVTILEEKSVTLKENQRLLKKTMTPEENHLLQSKELFLDAQHLFVIESSCSKIHKTIKRRHQLRCLLLVQSK